MRENRYFSLKEDVVVPFATKEPSPASFVDPNDLRINSMFTFRQSYIDLPVPKGTIVAITKYTQNVDTNVMYCIDKDSIRYVSSVSFTILKDKINCSMEFIGTIGDLLKPVDPKTVKVLFGQ